MKPIVTCLLVLVLLMPVLSACSASDAPLGPSMKGYELYSWQEEGRWHFTLITGTNRNKFLDEITSGEDVGPEDGWVRIQATGVDEVKALLGRVPEGEFVSWCDGGFVLPTEEAVTKLMLPPEDIINEIRQHAKQCSLDFLVSGSGSYPLSFLMSRGTTWKRSPTMP